MAEGERRISKGGNQFLLIDPSAAVQSVRTVHDVLSSLKGDVRICDPYLDYTTIEHLCVLATGTPTRLLTVTVKDEARVNRTLSAAQQDGRHFLIRIAPAGRLHDRYIIDDTDMFILGTSLNGLGKKQAFLIRAGEDFRGTMVAAFESLWAVSAPRT